MKIEQSERETQNRVVNLFQKQLGYAYYGNWQYRENNRNIEATYLRGWLAGRGVSEGLIGKALRELEQATALGDGKNLYDANKEVYGLLRYGVKVKEGAGEQKKTVWLIDWENPEANAFAIAEELSIKGENNKRPDIVIYVNGIALAVLELKSARADVAKGIRQNLGNQKKAFIRNFFTTIQLVLAGNDSQGVRYGTIETPEKYYLTWKEENPTYDPRLHDKSHRYLGPMTCERGDNLLDCGLSRLLHPSRLLELIHDFIVFDMGVKKLPRHNQYFGVQAAQSFVKRGESGIIWHTQGAGKSLTMVWLAKWVRENIAESRVLIITGRTELDEQIEGVFKGVDEDIYRTISGRDLVRVLDQSVEWLICSLVHKFGRSEKSAAEQFVKEVEQEIPINFVAKGKLFVFVDECHRTQSGMLNEAMKTLLPNATFIGFTGTPLLKADKQKSVEVFGRYIHTYKFDEAVRDGIVLDLRYEARDIDQQITSPQKIDLWFEAKTANLTDTAKSQLKQKWGTMQKLLSSHSRLEQIVNDIVFDMATRPRLMDGRGNAMLVCASIYQACKLYELFGRTELNGKCAIITSYKPTPADIKGEYSGDGLTEQLHQYDIYRQMLADYFGEPEETAMYKTEQFEQEVKKRFRKEPGQMRLLIVVDKLLTGFDAPSATYLYIDKQMRDHGLFQAICRVNRLDGDDKEYGYIIDYKDLFHSLEGAIDDYTSGALDGYDAGDVAGLLSDRLAKAKEQLDDSREQVLAVCEEVRPPKDDAAYQQYFVGDSLDREALQTNEPRRLALYKAVSAFVRAYANVATEMIAAGYTAHEAAKIKQEVEWFNRLQEEIKLKSGDYIDMKQYDASMRRLLDTYVRANDSEKISAFDELGLIELIVEQGIEAGVTAMPSSIRHNEDAMSETIENNVRKIITDEHRSNPKYYDNMSDLLDALIFERRNQAIEYKAYLEKIEALAKKVAHPEGADSRYPTTINTLGKRAIYDIIEDEAVALQVDTAICRTKKDSWMGNRVKEREVARVVREELGTYHTKLDEVMGVVKEQHEYR